MIFRVNAVVLETLKQQACKTSQIPIAQHYRMSWSIISVDRRLRVCDDAKETKLKAAFVEELKKINVLNFSHFGAWLLPVAYAP